MPESPVQGALGSSNAARRCSTRNTRRVFVAESYLCAIPVITASGDRHFRPDCITSRERVFHTSDPLKPRGSRNFITERALRVVLLVIFAFSGSQIISNIRVLCSASCFCCDEYPD